MTAESFTFYLRVTASSVGPVALKGRQLAIEDLSLPADLVQRDLSLPADLVHFPGHLLTLES